MKVEISKVVRDLYQENNKNYEYAIESLLNSLDPNSYESAITDIKKIESGSEKVEIDISDTTVKTIQAALNIENIKMETIELLLWVAVLFPEI